jgi:acid phosphatase
MIRLALACCVNLLLAAHALSAAAIAAGPALPRPAHVVIVVEENKNFADVIGNQDAPFINQIAQQGALFTRSYGVAHPSQPNYFALFAGVKNRNRDGCPATGVDPWSANLASELAAKRLSFAGYSETLPAAGFSGCFYGREPAAYARKHNAWVHFQNVPASANLPFSALPAYAALPTVAFIVPNEEHDMHSAPVAQGDDWLRSNIGPLLRWARGHNTLVIITWDEGRSFFSNHIPTLIAGPMVRPGRYGTRIDHYALLRTVEDFYGLPYAGNSSQVAPIVDCWQH